LKISTIFQRKKPTISFEFFPPKKVENEQMLFDTVDVLKGYNPDFVSITYGAGGSTKTKTLEWTIKLQAEYNLNTMMHLTCISSTQKDIDRIIEVLKDNGVDNILALRGDRPKDSEVKEGPFKYAYQLVEYLRLKNNFSIGVAGYPEGHPEAPSLQKDIEYLKMKVDAGADFIITQLFFDNHYFYDFVNRARQIGIKVPIVAGIMPAINLTQIERFVAMCGATVPARLINSLTGKDKQLMYTIGVEYATKQCADLLSNGVDGLHFYTLNRYNATKDIMDNLNIKREAPEMGSGA